MSPKLPQAIVKPMATGVFGTSSGYECERLGGAGQKSLRSVLNAIGPCKQSGRWPDEKKPFKTINYTYGEDAMAVARTSSTAPADGPGFDEELACLGWRSATPGVTEDELKGNGDRP